MLFYAQSIIAVISQRERERECNLLFYAQSIIAVISERERECNLLFYAQSIIAVISEREREREEEEEEGGEETNKQTNKQKQTKQTYNERKRKKEEKNPQRGKSIICLILRSPCSARQRKVQFTSLPLCVALRPHSSNPHSPLSLSSTRTRKQIPSQLSGLCQVSLA